MHTTLAAILVCFLFYPRTSSAEWVLEVLGPMDGRPTYATAINNRGDVVGFGFDENGANIPILWTRDGGFRKILESGSGQALDINNRGEVIGFYTPVPFGPSHAFVWSDTGGLLDLGTDFQARAINEAGVIAGLCGDPNPVDVCLWDRGTRIPLPTPFPGQVLVLNNRGDVAGFVADPQGPGEREQPTIWPRSDMARILPVPPGTLFAVANGLNSRRTVVGFAYLPFDGPRLQPLVWDANGALLPELQDVTGVAVAVNEAGMVVGNTPGFRNEDSRGFAWTRQAGLTILPGADASQPTDVNNAGDVVGVVYQNQAFYAAVWRNRRAKQP